jgi:uncharacterized protein
MTCAESALKPALTVLIVPGLRDHVPDHWQTHLQARLPRCVTMQPLEANRLSRAAQIWALDHALAQIEGPVILVAHSAGVITDAHWAALRHSRPIHGALLATPPDFTSPLPAGYPTSEVLAQNGWTPVPPVRLPFPAIVAASDNDPLASKESVIDMASRWGARLVELGDVGHLNPASGFGPWPRAEELIGQLV